MINRKITLLGPEGTNLYILFQFIVFSIISWFTLFTSVELIEFNTGNILSRQIVFSLVGIVVFFLTTYLSIENLYNLINPLFVLSISVLLGFIVGMIGWAVIIWEIFRGEASQAAASNESVSSAFNAMRLVVLVGWAIYPLGYVFGLMTGSVDADTLNWIYNLADFVNKILFGLFIWMAAVKDTAKSA